MPLPLRPRATPQCSACVRSYAFGGFGDAAGAATAWRQQVRGKKKLVNTSSTVPVRLLKNVKTFGRKGAIVPISVGQMRNEWFPRRVAEYVTVPELKTLRFKNVAMERDFGFGITNLAKEAAATTGGAIGKYQTDIPTDIRGMSTPELEEASMFQKKRAGPEKLSPERSVELLEIFVPPRLEFYRQPIMEEPESEPPAPSPEPKKSMRNFGYGAGAELLAARAAQPETPKLKSASQQAIYGSVSTADVLTAVKAIMVENDEAARVVLHAEDIKFVHLTGSDTPAETGRVKHVGDFAVEIGPKGAEKAVKRHVRVIAQEAA